MFTVVVFLEYSMYIKTTQKHFAFTYNMELELPSSDTRGFQYMNVWRNTGKTGGLGNRCLYRTGPCMAGHLEFLALTSKREWPTLELSVLFSRTLLEAELPLSEELD